jgi:hypothetical protein
MSAGNNELPFELQIRLDNQQETGVFADFANIWHTPSSFVLDFISVVQPAMLRKTEDGVDAPPLMNGTVCSRVRIPPEQIFQIIKALEIQSQQWLSESGRSEPPPPWNPDFSRETN